MPLNPTNAFSATETRYFKATAHLSDGKPTTPEQKAEAQAAQAELKTSSIPLDTFSTKNPQKEEVSSLKKQASEEEKITAERRAIAQCILNAEEPELSKKAEAVIDKMMKNPDYQKTPEEDLVTSRYIALRDRIELKLKHEDDHRQYQEKQEKEFIRLLKSPFTYN